MMSQIDQLNSACQRSRFDDMLRLCPVVDTKLLSPPLSTQVKEFLRTQQAILAHSKLMQHLAAQQGTLKEGVHMVTRVEGSCIDLFSESETELSGFNVCALLYEMKHYNKWLFENISMNELGSPSISVKVSKFRFYIPLVVDRYIHMVGMGFDRLNQGEVLVYGQQIFSDSNYAELCDPDQLAPKEKSTGRLNTVTFTVKKLTSGNFLVRQLISIDVQMSLALLPDALIRFGTQRFCLNMFKGLCREGKGLGPQMRACVQEDKSGFYCWLKNMLKQWQ